MVLGKLDNRMLINEVKTYPLTIHKTNSKWITDLNVRLVYSKLLDTIKLLEENIGKILFDMNYSNIYFLDSSSRVMETKEKIN